MTKTTLPPVSARLTTLNQNYTHRAALPVLRTALRDPLVGRSALVSSFGAESVVLLHLISQLDRDFPVIFLDTEMLFPETLAYQKEVCAFLGLTRVITAKPALNALNHKDIDNTLHKTDKDACCALRKTAPLTDILSGYDSWITGRKRYQKGLRATLDLFEADGPDRIKINPLAHWRAEDVQDYMITNDLPRHPLVAKGFGSIGCAPCTSPGTGRDGRWAGSEKTECGIHFGPQTTLKGAA